MLRILIPARDDAQPQRCALQRPAPRPFPPGTDGLADITPYGVLLIIDRLTNVLTALAHPTRRAIIGRLAVQGPTRFLDVARPFDTALNAVTKHLKLLERAGLIERRKQGREVLISFRGAPLRQVAGWVHEYERFWNARLDAFEQHFKNRKDKGEKKR